MGVVNALNKVEEMHRNLHYTGRKGNFQLESHWIENFLHKRLEITYNYIRGIEKSNVIVHEISSIWLINLVLAFYF